MTQKKKWKLNPKLEFGKKVEMDEGRGEDQSEGGDRVYRNQQQGRMKERRRELGGMARESAEWLSIL